jgi:multidrug efflux pump subunit AcrA (membrane-fusion protein)
VLAAHRAQGPARDGLIVPRSAIVRADGTLQVWRATGAENFERVPIDAATPVADGWFVPAGGALKPGDRLVVAGAGTLLGLERSSGGGGGD